MNGLSGLISGLLSGVVVMAVALVGDMDYDDHIREAELYCKNVHEELWPDYKQSYEEDCKDGEYIQD